MKTTLIFRRGLPALLAATGALLGVLSPAAHAHDVTDPVCRMSVDSDTTPFHQKLGGKTFHFCSKACAAKFAKAPAKYSKLADALERGGGRTYAVDLTSAAPPVAGKPAALTFAVRHADGTRAAVRDFETTHEKLMHLIVVSEDLSWFAHEHPQRGTDGKFRLTQAFPRAGRYRLYADFTPADGDNQVIGSELTVGGGTAPKPVPLTPDTRRTRQVNDLTFTLALRPTVLRAETPTLLTYTVRDRAGRPVRDMQPYLGAMGHLMAIRQDGREVVHTHALHAAGGAHHGHGESSGGLHLTPAMATASGPAQSFKLSLPSGGLYKVWAQFQRAGRIYTVPFTFRVADLWDAAPAPKAANASVQRATVRVDGGGYSPGAVTVQAGRPVELTFVAGKSPGCGDTIVFPDLGIRKALAQGGKTVIAFTPRKAGTLRFTCGMNMYQGKVIVR